MILAVICDVLGKENNGTTIAAMNLIRSMRAKGHTVRVVCPDSNRNGEEGYYVVHPIDFGPLNGYVSRNGVRIAQADEDMLRLALHGVDAVHIMTPFFLSSLAARIAFELGIPITAGFHCQAENFTNHIFLMNAHWMNHLMYKVFYRSLYRYAGCIHYPSQFICDVFEQEIGHATPHCVISNGVNKAFVRRSVQMPSELEDKFLVVFTGRLSREKCHKVLIDAIAKSRHADKIQLVCAGDGPLRKELIEYSERLPIRPIFRFFSREEMVRLLNCAHLYVHPAEIEIEAIACLEAISCGVVPVICNSLRSATRYFAKSDMNLFRCNDSSDLAVRIDWWLDHPEERCKCSQSYINYARQFDFDCCMDAMESMILDNIAATRIRSRSETEEFAEI